MPAYTKLGKSLADKLVELETDTLQVKLLSAYTIGSTRDTAQFEADIIVGGVGTEVATGAGYTVGGIPLTTVTLSETGHVMKLTCDNPSWAGATFSASFAVFIDVQSGAPATNPVLCYWDFGGPVTGGGGPFTLVVNAAGLLTLTAS